MYFWNIDGLIADLRRGPLSQRDGFAYLVATLLVYVSSGAGTGDRDVGVVGSVLLYLASIAMTLAGTYAAYRANGGADGVDFVGRYLGLGWVLAVRMLALVFPAYTIAVVLVSALVWTTVPDTTSVYGLPFWVIAMLFLGYNAIYYWRLVYHFGRVRSP